MYFALKSDCYFRKYESIGHLSRPIVGIEEVVDEIGSLFVQPLTYTPQSLDELHVQLMDLFNGVDEDTLKQDALAFYTNLAADGFLNASETLSDFKDDSFSYTTLKGRLAYKHINGNAEQSSEIFLGEYVKKSPFLQNFHIELTSRCNERCIHCYIPHDMKLYDIDRDLMINTLKQCRELGVMTVVFSGGEPMLHPNFTEFLRVAKDLDFNVTILTNLTLVTDEIMDAMKYKHIACANVSLYSMNSEIHDAITTVKGSFEKTKTNILQLIENNIPVQINCPIMKQNKDSFFDVINWGEEHKCSVVTDYTLMARSDRSIDNLDNRLTADDMYFVIKKIAENSKVFRTNLRTEGVFAGCKASSPNPDERVCGVGLSSLCMVANGNVYPCAGWQQYVCGNLKEQSLREIWEKSPEVLYLRSLRMRSFEKCIGCEDFNYCMMCISHNSNESPTGSVFDIPQITCDGARAHHKVSDEFKKKLYAI